MQDVPYARAASISSGGADDSNGEILMNDFRIFGPTASKLANLNEL